MRMNFYRYSACNPMRRNSISSPKSAPNHSATRLLAVLVGSVFLVEIVIMKLLRLLPDLPQFTSTLLDASLLSVVLFPIFYLLVFRPLILDINERQKTQDNLQLAASVFSHAREGILITDAAGNIIDVNDAFIRITGYSWEEVCGKNPRILSSGRQKPAFYAAMWESLIKNRHWTGEVWNRRKDGEAYAEILTISAIQNDAGGIQHYVALFTDITPLKRHQDEIEHIAFHDPLTQLPNRRLLADRIQQALAHSQRSGEHTAVVCLDLDGFKAVNDSLGHDAGDILLVETAHRLISCVRTGDTVARLGGDEFVLLLCGLTSPADCENTLKRVLTDLATPFNLSEGRQGKISGSLGYTLYPDDSADADTLLRHADHAMYAAKQDGKNRFLQFNIKQDNRVKANLGAVTRLEDALTRGEFRLYLQPKVDLNTGAVVGAEALLRWIHPIRGLIPPNQFLPLINDNDLALGVGDWVIKEGLRILAEWNLQGLELPLSVNVSARQLREQNFPLQLAANLANFPQVQPQRLELEIVESAALDDIRKVSLLISECQKLGVLFALDDFGTGYSSLTYLKRLSVNALKIDQTFVRDMLEDDGAQAIVRGIIGLSQAFNSHTIAEGVESWDMAAKLKMLGCDSAQGFIIARPMPAEEFPKWVSQFKMPVL